MATNTKRPGETLTKSEDETKKVKTSDIPNAIESLFKTNFKQKIKIPQLEDDVKNTKKAMKKAAQDHDQSKQALSEAQEYRIKMKE